MIEKLREEGKIGLDESLSLSSRTRDHQRETIAQLMTLESQLDDSGKFPVALGPSISPAGQPQRRRGMSQIRRRTRSPRLDRRDLAASVRDLGRHGVRKTRCGIRKTDLGRRPGNAAGIRTPSRLPESTGRSPKQPAHELARNRPDLPRMMLIDGKIKLAEYPNAPTSPAGPTISRPFPDSDAGTPWSWPRRRSS